MVNKCNYCNKPLYNKSSRAKYCDYLCKSRYLRGIVISSNRVCKLCGIDISKKRTNARFCCKEHKERHYRDTHIEQYREYKRNRSDEVKEREKIRAREKRHREIKEIGFSKNYLSTYAQRHVQDLIKLKGKMCEHCNTKRYLEIHHVKYTKDPNDWIFLCRDCHMKLHNPRKIK